MQIKNDLPICLDRSTDHSVRIGDVSEICNIISTITITNNIAITIDATATLMIIVTVTNTSGKNNHHHEHHHQTIGEADVS